MGENVAVALARFALLLLAVVACAWFVLSFEQARGTTGAETLIDSSNQLSAAQTHSAASLLSTARALNPDTTVDILRAQLDLDQNRRGQATRILEHVVHSEPQNVAAWAALAATTANRQEFDTAVAHVARLDPRIR